MAKTLTEATISTRNARSKLAEGVHWRGLNADVHLGYRRGKRAGRWLVRWYVGDRKYQQETIGVADDALEADGDNCLTFEQAKTKALRTVKERKDEQRAAAAGPAPTVASVVEAYMKERDSRERARGEKAKKSDARRRLTKHVMSAPVAAKALFALKEGDLSKWKADLPSSLASATVRRLVNDFKAAVNAGAVKHRAHLPADIGLTIKNGLIAGEASAPVARDKQALSDGEVRKLIEATKTVDADGCWDGDLLRMVVTLAATGARFSQVRRMAVGDVQVAQSRLMVPVSRKGRGTKNATHIGIRVGADTLSTLRPAITGRRASDPLLERWQLIQVAGTDGQRPKWERDTRAPWAYASELTRAWHLIIKVAELPAETVPYALRHSSIVRQLRAGLPVRLVAALHDTSTRMIETHYAAAIVDALDELSAGAIIPLIPDNGGEKVTPIRAGMRAANPQG